MCVCVYIYTYIKVEILCGKTWVSFMWCILWKENWNTLKPQDKNQKKKKKRIFRVFGSMFQDFFIFIFFLLLKNKDSSLEFLFSLIQCFKINPLHFYSFIYIANNPSCHLIFNTSWLKIMSIIFNFSMTPI